MLTTNPAINDINVSEQEALDCTFADSNCIVGGWHEEVLLYLRLQGLISGYTYPYHEAKQLCTSNMARNYFVLNFGYIRDASMPDSAFIPSNDALKASIMRYGTLPSGVTTTPSIPGPKSWDQYAKRNYYTHEVNPNWTTDFPQGVFPGTPSKSIMSDIIDHEVAIVGWDDTLGDHGCWLIKNSWGTDWGDEGYMKLPYDCNNIGYAACWLTVPPLQSPNIAALAHNLREIGLSEIKSAYPAIRAIR
jgi:hypothetical protein